MFRILNKKIVFYYAILLTAIVNLPRLLVNNQHFTESRMLPFDWAEWFCSILLSFLYVLIVFYLSDKKLFVFYSNKARKETLRIVVVNVGLWLLFVFIGAIISRLFIHSKMFPMNGYVLRFTALLLLSIIALRIMAINYQTQEKEKEIQALRLVNTQKDLSLLKSQLSPHFLFNAFSSLSGVIYENPEKAQKYVVQLSQYFRYSLENKNENISNLEEELKAVENYCGILQMRLEDGFQYKIHIDKTQLYKAHLPHISLQPLIENAVKHNIATANNPLLVDIFDEGNCLIVKNNMQKKPFPESGTGTGLSNLAERYQLLFKKEIEVSNDGNYFTIKLPLV
ncbi:sensor histidine kinase [Rhizosphaericola mali]|uniref:Signal transduction histidine kinase internal region domain-containing protein n=1 Tax=Rhizosphaericola mali TaxID=2545455 RepID=A0A5P2G9A1_9BACT|nr:histidine kinase [Rhizosphaericola mali]QES88101.1 hypothetical protein E0W69_005280 [Rhizosphaericola mali]